MEITVNRLDIKNAVERIIAAVPRKANIPILSHIQAVGVAGSGLRLFATDLRVHATIECRADVEDGKACAIPADKLHGIIDSAGAEILCMSLADNMGLEVIGDTRKYTVSCLDADEFPEYPNKPSTGELQIGIGVLPDLIAAVDHACSRDESKTHLCGVHIVTEGGRLTAVTTDGHRLALASLTIPGITGRWDDAFPGITIPAQACKLVSGISAAIEYRMSEDSNTIHLDGGGLGLAVRLLEGQFPSFRRVVPENLDSAFTVSAADFSGAIEACGVMIEGASKSVRLTMAEDTLTISALSIAGIASATIPAMGDPGLDIRVNSRFLLQSVKSIGGEIFIKYKDSLNPLMLIPVDHGKWDERLEILMPLRDDSLTVTVASPPERVVDNQSPSISGYIQQGFSRDEAKLLLAGFILVRYHRPEKAIWTAFPLNGKATWCHHVRSPFETYSLAERQLKEALSQPGYIEVSMTGEVHAGQKHRELFAAGFDLYRSEGIISGHGTPRIKCASKNWGSWQKYDSGEEAQTAWDELMKSDKALKG
jgi:DNA polymerase-3 subunit beta